MSKVITDHRAAVAAVALVLTLGGIWSWLTQQQTTTTTTKESTATINAYLETAKTVAAGGDETRWKTVTVEEFNPRQASGSYADDGMKRRKTTTYYFDTRVKPRVEVGRGKN